MSAKEDLVKKSWPWGNTPPARRALQLAESAAKIEMQKRIETENYEARIRQLDMMLNANNSDIEQANTFRQEEIRRGNIRIATALLELYGVDRLDYAKSESGVEDRREILKRALAKAKDGKLPEARDHEKTIAQVRSKEDRDIEEIIGSLGILRGVENQ
jgi:hypothetical protein